MRVLAHLPGDLIHELREQFRGKNELPKIGEHIAIGRKVYRVNGVLETADEILPTLLPRGAEMLQDWRRIFGDTKPVGYEHTIHLYLDGPIGTVIWAKKVKAS